MAQLTAVSSPVVQRHTPWMRRGRDHVRQGRDHVRQARDHVRRNRNHVRQGHDHVRQSASRLKVPVCKCIDHPRTSPPRTFVTVTAENAQPCHTEEKTAKIFGIRACAQSALSFS